MILEQFLLLISGAKKREWVHQNSTSQSITNVSQTELTIRSMWTFFKITGNSIKKSDSEVKRVIFWPDKKIQQVQSDFFTRKGIYF